MKQLEVQIMGQSYLLRCPENGDARLLEAVSKVDAAMCKIRDAGKIKARDRIAVLAALNLAFELPERSASRMQTHAEAQPQDAAAPTEADAEAANPQLGALLQRLDAALGHDTRRL
ncbi:MAG: cell division protein ZapA [Polaromonas sp.]|uniref:cell division protein ZapA n=1 Tax=Polaromonas sp. TaxID=1869339 RepID=UPI002731657A|nr:cell division protein ZapA [Polaromonas sp.]MDP2256804.1 cell division protein ZapA [Polaromonas sp.]MDP3708839.1 cell division protein ZapA [Polaromonas sp.]